MNAVRMTPALTLMLACATGLSVANIYYAQPMLGLIQQTFGDAYLVGLIPATTQLGFALGLLLLVPLGDTLDRRRLILTQNVALIVALVAAGLAPSAFGLLAASVLLGSVATIAQQIIPLAAGLAEPSERGGIIGRIMSGLLSGILLARVLSGTAAAQFGWRATFLAAAVVAALMGVMLFFVLPARTAVVNQSYRSLMRSMVTIAATQPSLRHAIVVQGSLFAAFSAFWSTLALLLATPEYQLGSQAAGLFGILGLTGIVAAPLAGRIADRRGPEGTILVGVSLVLGSYVLFAVLAGLAGLVLGVILLDAGIQMAMVAHQSIIFALLPDARNRLNTIYMTGLFLAGALGSAAGSFAFAREGWRGVTAVGLVCGVVACAVHWATRRGGRGEAVPSA